MINSNALNSIDWGTSVSGTVIRYSFAPQGTRTNNSEAFGLGESFTAEAFNAYETAQFRAALNLISSVTGITFVEVSNYASADLRFMLDTNELGDGLGIMLPPGESGAGLGIFSGANWDRSPGGDLEIGGFGFVTIVHEILHGLGLAHPHDFGGFSSVMFGVFSDFDDTGTYNLNQGVYTTMSYNSGLYDGDGIGANSTAANFGYEAGPMALDIAVLQDKYGINPNHNNGNSTYTLPGVNGNGTYWTAIWDTGGTDLIRYEGNRNVTINLNAATLQDEEGGGGYLSAANGIQGGFTIANNVVIENAESGNGNDILLGNSADNDLRGRGGNDNIKGGAGEDRLSGGGGNDTMRGGADDDVLNSGGGNDKAIGQGGDDKVKGGGGNDRLSGNGAEDTLNGGGGNDFLHGGGQDDRLRGGGGDDTLRGGAGADEFIFSDGFDSDLIDDFDITKDVLRINDDLLDGEMTGQAIVDEYGSVQGGDVVLDFGDGDVIRLDGVSSLDAVADQIEIF